MNIARYSFNILLCIFLFATYGKAQYLDDIETRTSVSLGGDIMEDWSIQGTYYLYLDNMSSHFSKSLFSVETEYKVNKWFEPGIEYRFGTNYVEDYHDFRLYATFDHDLFSDRWKIEYRPMFQREYESFDKEYLSMHPADTYLRLRLTVSYDLTNSIKLFAFTENYRELEEKALKFHQEKSAVGAEFELGERSELELRLTLKNKTKSRNIGRIAINYSYEIKPKEKPTVKQ